jgi:hypothetical protein
VVIRLTLRDFKECHAPAAGPFAVDNKDLVTKAVNARRSSRLGGTAPDADTDQRVEDQ